MLGGDGMNFNLNESQILNILKSLRTELANAKTYYEEHQEQEERIGITSPEEWKETYNAIIKQAHEQDNLTLLELIK